MKHLIKLLLAMLGNTHIGYSGKTGVIYYNNKNGFPERLMLNMDGIRTPKETYYKLCQLAKVSPSNFYKQNHK